jgi:hypothetical protein
VTDWLPADLDLEKEGVDPELVAALERREADRQPGGSPYELPRGEFYEEAPDLWLPLGASKTAIVCAGLAPALSLASLLFEVTAEGIRRRPRLPQILRAAVPVVIHPSHPAASLEWLVDEWAVQDIGGRLELAGFREAFLALGGTEEDFLLDRDWLNATCLAVSLPSLVVTAVPLDDPATLTDVASRSAASWRGRATAVAAVLDYSRQVADSLGEEATGGGERSP